MGSPVVQLNFTVSSLERSKSRSLRFFNFHGRGSVWYTHICKQFIIYHHNLDATKSFIGRRGFPLSKRSFLFYMFYLKHSRDLIHCAHALVHYDLKFTGLSLDTTMIF